VFFLRKNLLDRIKGFFDIPSFDLPAGKEERIIEQIVRSVSAYGLEMPAIMFTMALEPVSPIFSQITLLPLATMAEFIGLRGFDYVAFFNKRENIEKLLKRLEELRDLRER
jgi:hypothetical protein